MMSKTTRKISTVPDIPCVPETAKRPGRRVLVVDDNADLRKLVSLYLGGVGFFVAEAENGYDAFKLFQRRRFDLVITDLQMPVMDGLTLMTKIKAVSRNMPVMVMTGGDVEKMRQIERMNVAAAVLYKPFSFSRLKSALDALWMPEVVAYR